MFYEEQKYYQMQYEGPSPVAQTDYVYLQKGKLSKSWTFVNHNKCIRKCKTFYVLSINAQLGNVLFIYGSNHILASNLISVYAKVCR